LKVWPRPKEREAPCGRELAPPPLGMQPWPPFTATASHLAFAAIPELKFPNLPGFGVENIKERQRIGDNLIVPMRVKAPEFLTWCKETGRAPPSTPSPRTKARAGSADLKLKFFSARARPDLAHCGPHYRRRLRVSRGFSSTPIAGRCVASIIAPCLRSPAKSGRCRSPRSRIIGGVRADFKPHHSSILTEIRGRVGAGSWCLHASGKLAIERTVMSRPAA
jgi:hypothetical protein